MFRFMAFDVVGATPLIVSVLLSVPLITVCPFHVSVVCPVPVTVIVSVELIVERSARMPLKLIFVLLST
jgi:hypothetical protein